MNLENKIYVLIFTLITIYRYTLYIDWHGNMSKIQGFFWSYWVILSKAIHHDVAFSITLIYWQPSAIQSFLWALTKHGRSKRTLTLKKIYQYNIPVIIGFTFFPGFLTCFIWSNCRLAKV